MYARRQFSLFFIKNSWCCRLLIFFKLILILCYKVESISAAWKIVCMYVRRQFSPFFIKKLAVH